MIKNKMRIFLSFALALMLGACNEQQSNNKLVINEVLVENSSNFQDDYGMRSGWIEIFNKAYSSADLAGCLLKVSSNPGDTTTYFIPKGDILTNIKPRQHTLFWADANPRRGTFHTNFLLSTTSDNWIGLYDSGKKIMDQVIVPHDALKANTSYARIVDASPMWEVKNDIEDKYVTPSTNNQTIENNPKMDKFELHDASGVGMAISAMSVVFSGLLLLFLCFRMVGKTSIYLRKRNAMQVQNITDLQEANDKRLGEAPGEVIAAITMALHEAQGADHDVEETILTISRVKRSYSPWSSKIYTLRNIPNRK